MNTITKTFTKIIDTIGFFGPQLLFLSSIYFLYYKFTSLIIYVVGFTSNTLLNIILKSLIQEPRPLEDKRLFNLEILNGNRMEFDRYGMPSGHSQSVFYSTIFIFLTLKNQWISFVYLIITILTSYQRIEYKNHTLGQVFIGAILGIFMSLLFYYYATKIIKGNLEEKKDDNAPYY